MSSGANVCATFLRAIPADKKFQEKFWDVLGLYLVTAEHESLVLGRMEVEDAMTSPGAHAALPATRPRTHQDLSNSLNVSRAMEAVKSLRFADRVLPVWRETPTSYRT